MPASETDTQADNTVESFKPLTELPFPPVTRSHILNCSVHSWYPRYRAVAPKSRLIPLNDAFVSYLKADGILLPPEDTSTSNNEDDWDSDSGIFSKEDEEIDEDDTPDPSRSWPDIHQSIITTINELGGKVNPKLNWSCPKDATWINTTNSIECRTPNDVYLLLKSSDFITHDLDYAFEDTTDDSPSETTRQQIPYNLLLRKHVPGWNPALEFRAFVRERQLIGVCQRDQNYYHFLHSMHGRLLLEITKFFETHLREEFPDENFVFDVYVPGPRYNKVWLVDVNPWAVRTDPLLFSWLELLTMAIPSSGSDDINDDDSEVEKLETEVVRLQLGRNSEQTADHSRESSEDSVDEEEEYDMPETPELELRLVHKDDPEATNFNSPKYSAHKLPREVVEASQSGPGPMREFAERWKEVLEKAEKGGGSGSADGDGDESDD